MFSPCGDIARIYLVEAQLVLAPAPTVGLHAPCVVACASPAKVLVTRSHAHVGSDKASSWSVVLCCTC